MDVMYGVFTFKTVPNLNHVHFISLCLFRQIFPTLVIPVRIKVP